MRFSREYFSTLDRTRPPLMEVSAQIASHPRLALIVAEWFVMLFHVIRATTPLLTRARDASCLYGEGPFEIALRSFYERKLKEEAGHDTMLVADAQHLGRSPEQLHSSLPLTAVAAMVGSQYYLIDYIHPAAYLGYVGLLEGYPMTPKQIDFLVERSGTPPQAWSTMRMHSEVDGSHREGLEEILDRVPANEPRVRMSIILNGLRSAEFQRCALQSLLEGAQHRTQLLEVAHG